MKIASRSACGNFNGSFVHSISNASTRGSAFTIMSFCHSNEQERGCTDEDNDEEEEAAAASAAAVAASAAAAVASVPASNAAAAAAP